MGSIPPVADFFANTLVGYAPFKTIFYDASLEVPEYAGYIVQQWLFGNGGIQSFYEKRAAVSYTYLLPGTFTVSLRVWNDYGEDQETKTAYIVVLPAAQSPKMIANQLFMQEKRRRL